MITKTKAARAVTEAERLLATVVATYVYAISTEKGRAHPAGVPDMMNSNIYEGDEWKRTATAVATTAKPTRTRAQEQEFIDTEFCNGRMTRKQWSDKFDELSSVEKWSAKGPTR